MFATVLFLLYTYFTIRIGGISLIKVCKFGGSSLADAGQFRKVADIVREDISRKVIVVSACGKSEVESEKITDLLYRVYRCIEEGADYNEIWKNVVRRYTTIRDELGIAFDIESELVDIYNKLSNGIDKNYLVSRGEYLCALLMARYLNYTFIDATEVLLFTMDGVLNKEISRNKISDILSCNDGIVIPGFYGSLENGKIYTLGRGGSDVSGAFVADLIHADMYENWSDVSGIFVVDPRIIPDPLKCEHISYQKVRILTHLGANILHEETIFPLISRNISLVIRNTNAPQDTGTLVNDQEIDTSNICGIAGKNGYSLLRIHKEYLTDNNDWLLTITHLFTRFNITIEHISNGIDNFSIVFRSSDHIDTLLSSLQHNTYEYTPSLALLGIVGNSDRVMERALKYLHDSDIVVYTYIPDQDASLLIIKDSELENAIRILYSAFIR